MLPSSDKNSCIKLILYQVKRELLRYPMSYHPIDGEELTCLMTALFVEVTASS